MKNQILCIFNYPLNEWNPNLKNYLINISNKLKDNFNVFFCIFFLCCFVVDTKYVLWFSLSTNVSVSCTLLLNSIPDKRNDIYNVNIILVIVYFNIKSKHFHFVYLGIGKHAFLLQLSHHKNSSLDFTFLRHTLQQIIYQPELSILMFIIFS